MRYLLDDGLLNLAGGHGLRRQRPPLGIWPEFRFTRCLEQQLSKSSQRSQKGPVLPP